MNAQEPWKGELLQGTVITGPTDQFSQHILQANPLYMCSDGGTKGHTGSFSLVVATADQTLWECTGTASGWHANSFRSEAIGQLALLVFHKTCVTFHQLQEVPVPKPTATEPWTRIATDNNQNGICRSRT
jgi:hypothetical protein